MKTVHGVDYTDKGPPGPLIGALVREPFMAARHHIVSALRTAGFGDIQAAHLAVFQFPGPAGRTPGELANAAGASKQAMNNLLAHLERSGYLIRTDHPGNRRERLIELTPRGELAITTIRAAVTHLEDTWRDALGAREYDELRTLLVRLSAHLAPEPTQRPTLGRPSGASGTMSP